MKENSQNLFNIIESYPIRSSEIKEMYPSDIFPSLINLYSDVIDTIEDFDDVQDIFDTLKHFNMTEGICWCSVACFRVRIIKTAAFYSELKRRKNGNMFDIPPRFCSTKEDIINVLDARVKAMKTILQNEIL